MMAAVISAIAFGNTFGSGSPPSDQPRVPGAPAASAAMPCSARALASSPIDASPRSAAASSCSPRPNAIQSSSIVPRVDEPAAGFEDRSADQPDRPHPGEGDVVVADAVAAAGVGEQVVELRPVGLRHLRPDRRRVGCGALGGVAGAADRLHEEVGQLDERLTARRVLGDHPPGVVGQVVVEGGAGLGAGGAHVVE